MENQQNAAFSDNPEPLIRQMTFGRSQSGSGQNEADKIESKIIRAEPQLPPTRKPPTKYVDIPYRQSLFGSGSQD